MLAQTFGAIQNTRYSSPPKSMPHDIGDAEIDQDDLNDLKRLVLNSADKKAIYPDLHFEADTPQHYKQKKTLAKFDLNPEFLF